MSEVIKKRFYEWEFDKEEKWLNEMIEQGLVLKKVQGNSYTFTKCEPKEYKIKVEAVNMDFWSKKTQEHERIIKEAGAEIIDSQGVLYTTIRIYIKNKWDSEDFSLYYDNKAKLTQSNKMLLNQMVIFLIWVALGFNLNIYRDFISNPLHWTNILFLVLYTGMLLLLAVDIAKVLLVRRRFKETT